MTAFAGWQIDLIDGTGATNLTSYVQGFTIRCNVNIGRFTPTDVIVTLNNDGGEFTPAAGGGTGSFASTNWLTKAIRIAPSANVNLFTSSTFVNDFRMRDNGTNSSVELLCQDWLSLASSPQSDITEDTNTLDFTDIIENVLEGSSGFGSGATFPDFGLGATHTPVPQMDNFSELVGNTMVDQLARPAATNVSSLDYLNQAVFNGYPCVVIPTAAVIQVLPATGIIYTATTLNRTLTYENVFRTTFAFSENPSGTTLAFDTIEPGFDFDSLTNTTTVVSGITGVTSQTSTNTATGNSYGTRARKYTNTGNAVESDSGLDAGALEAAKFWTSRQAEARYIPRRLTTSIELIDERNGSTAAATLMALMQATTGLFQPCDITYTPTGGTQVTANCVISGRTIQAVPGRTTITLDLLPAQDYQSFVLDSSSLGVLNTNRVG